jgi:hypothetical protein
MSTIQRIENGLLVSADLLGTLGELISTPKSAISPLRYSPPRALNPQLRQDFVIARVLNPDGSLNAEAQRALETLALAVAFTRVQYSGGPSFSEMVFYHAPKAQAPISVTNTDDGLLIEYPGQPADFSAALRDLSGGSQLQNLDFSARLPVTESLVLAAMVDLLRKDILRDTASDQPLEIGNCSPEFIVSELGKSQANSSGLANVVAQVSGAEPGLAVMNVKSALEALVAKELVIVEASGYTLNALPALLARRFLLFDQAFKLEAGREALAGSPPILVGFMCLQAGVHDLLYLEYAEELLLLETVSASTLLDRLKFFINQPDELEWATTEAAVLDASHTLASSAAGPVCARCAKPLKPGVKFCGKCGQPVEQ